MKTETFPVSSQGIVHIVSTRCPHAGAISSSFPWAMIESNVGDGLRRFEGLTTTKRGKSQETCRASCKDAVLRQLSFEVNKQDVTG